VAGLTDIITVLDSQRRALTAESAWLAVRRERIDTRIDLFLALGGGFEHEENPDS
jgi:outer membrane protein TolC